MNSLIQSIAGSMNTLSNFFSTLFNGINQIIVFAGDGIEFVIYSVKTIFSLFTSIF